MPEELFATMEEKKNDREIFFIPEKYLRSSESLRRTDPT